MNINNYIPDSRLKWLDDEQRKIANNVFREDVKKMKALCEEFNMPHELFSSGATFDNKNLVHPGTSLAITSVIPDNTNKVWTITIDLKKWKQLFKNQSLIKRLCKKKKKLYTVRLYSQQ